MEGEAVDEENWHPSMKDEHGFVREDILNVRLAAIEEQLHTLRAKAMRLLEQAPLGYRVPNRQNGDATVRAANDAIQSARRKDQERLRVAEQLLNSAAKALGGPDGLLDAIDSWLTAPMRDEMYKRNVAELAALDKP